MWVEPGLLDLTYCTNIHTGESWSETKSNIETHARELKAIVSPDGSFGIGLRLSAAAVADLLQGHELAAFRSFLDRNGLYVAVINGVSFGSFHCGSVKTGVFAPDWRSAERVRYTLNLVRVLECLLPEGTDGGISTIPLSYKPWLRRESSEFSSLPQIVSNLVVVVEELVRVRRETGKVIHIDIEPGPDGMVENTSELLSFFDGPLCQTGPVLLSGLLGVSEQEARGHILCHLRVCFDTCHMLVEYEDLIDSIRRIQQHGVAIGRLQLSSALEATFGQAPEVRAQLLSELRQFAEPVYLHQVIEQRLDRSLRHFHDLDAALEYPLDLSAKGWRIHYHVPLFTDIYGSLSTTQQGNREILSAIADSPFTTHLEIETYTWDILPAALKLTLLRSIAREYEWVLDQLRQDGAAHAAGKTRCA